MFRIVYVQNNELENDELNLAISLKQVAWKYSYRQQLSWIENNINEEDLHVFLFENNKAVAYMNMVYVKLIIDDCELRVLGIGNVCSVSPGYGYGKTLLSKVNLYLIENNIVGLLFCKDALVSYYQKCGWNLIPKNKLNVNIDQRSFSTMFYNYHKSYKSIIYNDRNF